MLSNWIEVVRTCNLPADRNMDVVSKWLIITRACVFNMTIISCFIGGMLAGIDGRFNAFHFFLVLFGLILGHASNNMVNDVFDVRQGVDTRDYPRARYAPHPILDGLVTKKGLVWAIFTCSVIDCAIAVYLTAVTGWPVMAFAVSGFLFSVFYVAPPLKLKHRGLGEPAIFLIWGPLMIGGTYFVMAGHVSVPVFLASVPYGLGVTAVLMGKHIDKREKDAQKRVHTLPVLLGEKNARMVMQAMVAAFYLLTGVEALVGILPVWVLVVFISLPKAAKMIKALSSPIPETPHLAFTVVKDIIPRDFRARYNPDLSADAFPLWPLWFVVWGVWWVRSAGGLLVVGLMIALFF